MKNGKIWINRANSFKEAEEFDTEYYMSMSGNERLEIMQYLREIYFYKIKGKDNANRKGLRRVIRVIK